MLGCVALVGVSVPFCVVQAVLYKWHCLWTSVLEIQQDGAIVGVPPSFGSIVNSHFRVLAATPLQQVVRYSWTCGLQSISTSTTSDSLSSSQTVSAMGPPLH